MAKAQKLNWEMTSTLMARRMRSDGRTLLLYTTHAVDKSEWLVFAVESDFANEETKELAAARLLESHSHQLLEPQPSLEEALASAERYAKWWSKTRAVHADCGCEPIEEAALAAGE